jgi:endonuclease/exonuclease/phosphatase family metal-dependent hydrolase
MKGKEDCFMKLLSLNLHGHHPMGEPDRWLEDRQGRIRRADTNLHFFTAEEMDRGGRRRLDRLGVDLSALAPDVICLQEVAAGCPWTELNEAIFLREYPRDWFEANSALRLLQRLNARLPESSHYQAALGFRGNVGWMTSPGVFERDRIVVFEGSQARVVFDHDDNPYPKGVLVEGFAVLVRPPWRVVEHDSGNLMTGSRERFFVQRVVVRKGDGPCVAIANMHLGHKLRHFEQALAVRRALAEMAERHAVGGQPARVVATGDFNATLYRPANAPDPRANLRRDPGPAGRPVGPPDGGGEPSTIPWEIQVPGQFDYRPGAGSMGELLERLWRLNDDDRYKPWSGIRDAEDANRRIRAMAAALFEAQEQPSPLTAGWREAVETARKAGKTGPLLDLPWAEDVNARIDYIFVDARVGVERACMVYPENGWASTAGTSDHPAAYAELTLG